MTLHRATQLISFRFNFWKIKIIKKEWVDCVWSGMFLLISGQFPYFHHIGCLSSRHHTHTCHHPSVLHYSGHFYNCILDKKKSQSLYWGIHICSYFKYVYCICTLITVDAIFSTLTSLTGRSVKTLETATHSSPVYPIWACSITKAGLTLWARTRFAVLPKITCTALVDLKKINYIIAVLLYKNLKNNVSLYGLCFINKDLSWKTYDVGLVTGSSAANGQQPLLLKHST